MKDHDLFFCTPYNVRLSRRSCGLRHREVRSRGEKGKLKLGTVTCVHCPVGAEHAKRRSPSSWPDGSPIVMMSVKPRTGEKRVEVRP